MTEIPNITRNGPEVWHLALPDWGAIDNVWRRHQPFALWSVGEQALLFHWLDAAVNQGSETVELTVADRPIEVRQAIAEASLWPIEIKVQSAASIDPAKVDDVVDRLPNTPALKRLPTDGWSLITHWFELEQNWLELFAEETRDYGNYAAIGRNCMISPEAELIPPFWIGSFVSIGPGCKIGPGAVVEDGSVLAGGNRVERGHVGAYTYLGPETDLIDAVIDKNELINVRRQGHIKNLESFVASGLGADQKNKAKGPSIRERWIALELYLRWIRHGFSSESEFTDLNGTRRPALADHSIHARRPWLREVIAGKLLLFGVTPRPVSALNEVPEEWHGMLREAAAGAFSYADVVGAHDIGSAEETLHSVYQTGANADHCKELFNKWLQQLK
ncbi:MAG: hypothetical protein AAGH40_03410 [Verrucomicrobiota bacterium]